MAKRKRKPSRATRKTRRPAYKPLPAPPTAPAPDADAPTAADRAAAALVDEPPRAPWRRLLVGREHRHRLEIRLANCSITEVDARSYVLGLFCEVAPSGAASAIDEALDGAVTEFTQRRMYSGRVGEVFVMPANRRQLPTDSVLWVGLGFFDKFDENVLQIAAENAIRTLIRTRIEDFATVLMGAGSGKSTRWLVDNLITGLVRGKRDADRDHSFRRITICEIDPHRYEEICQEVFHLASTPLCEDVELCISEVPPEDLRQVVRRPFAKSPEPIYLIVRQEAAKTGRRIAVRASTLTAGGKAAVNTRTQEVNSHHLAEFYQEVDAIKPESGRRATLATLRRLGSKLRSLVLHELISEELNEYRDHHLAIVHDAETSRLPWELLAFDDWVPALGKGVSRRYMADNLSIVKLLSRRVERSQIRMLIVINPTEDLDGAEEEGKRVQRVIGNTAGFQVEPVRGPEATRDELLERFQSGEYDVVHYAGHAFFDPRHRSQSGLICAGEEVLSGADLINLPQLPTLVVFNACESGRVRHFFARKKKEKSAEDEISVAQLNVGLAEAFLRGGVANYVGTYWPVDDAPAESFATHFYTQLLQGEPLGDALAATRKILLNKVRSIDWADYIHFGDQNFALRTSPDANNKPK